MRIGILTCDAVREPLAARHGEYHQMFERLLTAVRPELEIVPFRVYEGEYPARLDVCDAYVITGSRYSVYEPTPWIRRLEDYVRALYQARRPTVGVCFGHQMMGLALGGRTEKAAQGWGIGRQAAEVLKPAAWMEPFAAQYAVFVSHQDQVTVLPPGAERLATNPYCPNAMFVAGDIFLGIQGHPEFTGAYARDLVVGREALYGAELIARAMPTYAQPVDSLLVARWMLAFLERHGRSA